MALRTTLNDIVEMVRGECKLSTNTSRGVDHRDYLVQLIRRHYQMLAEDYDWQHLELKKTDAVSRVHMQAGSRYYNFPAAVNVQKITRAHILWSGTWHELDYGVNYAEYTALSSESDERTDPPQSWGYYGDEQFEVWPMPATDYSATAPYSVAFEGQRAITALTSNNDRADMDDILIALFVSAEVLGASEKKTAAELKMGAATARLNKLRGNLGDHSRVRMGLGRIGGGRAGPRTIDYVRKEA